MIHNPVLRGFHPDPSIVRVGEDYYLANSTFEWFPGVRLFHSRDLSHWQPVGHALTRRSQLELRGIPDSGGLWAPSISHDGERFYLVVCHVRTRSIPFKDMRVMLYTAEQIEGPWSDGVYLGGSGFDPSIFHDPNTGRKWLVNIQWDYRGGQPRFGGIVIREYDPSRQRLVGPQFTILTKPQLIEGPNLYYHDGWYYLMCAEGGTGWNHGISMARSRDLLGPYEIDPQPLVLTSRQNPGNPLQKAGHGEIVQTPAGEWYLVHLASRPLYPERRCPLGRETCIQKVVWDPDGWLRLAHGGCEPLLDVEAPKGIDPHPWPAEVARDDFDAPMLSSHWQSLRVSVDESWASLSVRPGWLRLRGRESLHSLFEQSLLARRIDAFCCRVETAVEFIPDHFTQSAGLIVYYDTQQHVYLRITQDERVGGRILGIVQTDAGDYSEPVDAQLCIKDWPTYVYLRAEIDHETLRFFASPDSRSWQPVGGAFDMTKLSDDYGNVLRFTGAMVGICCQDLNTASTWADFDYFEMDN